MNKNEEIIYENHNKTEMLLFTSEFQAVDINEVVGDLNEKDILHSLQP